MPNGTTFSRPRNRARPRPTRQSTGALGWRVQRRRDDSLRMTRAQQGATVIVDLPAVAGAWKVRWRQRDLDLAAIGEGYAYHRLEAISRAAALLSDPSYGVAQTYDAAVAEMIVAVATSVRGEA